MPNTMTAPAKDDDNGGGGSHASDLQQHLQLEACDGKYLTRQEIMLLELFQSVHQDGSKNAPLGILAASSGVTGSSIVTNAQDGHSTAAGVNSAALKAASGSTSSSAAAANTKTTSATTPKRQLSSDRERVQHFLLQRQSSTGGAVTATTTATTTTSNSVPATAAAAAKQPALSAIERAKLLMAKKSSNAPAKALGVKRTNPLTDILKGGSGSIVGGTSAAAAAAAAKRPRTKSDKPGEIRIQGGRNSIQLPLESFLRSDDWDTTTAAAPLELVLPEVAFATNNTLIVHATMPTRAAHCCFNISTQTSLLSGAPYPGTVLYHFNPRRQRGGTILQNSNIDGRWGCFQPLPRCPIVFGEPFTLRLTIIPTGFLVFLDEIWYDEFKHRVPIREGEHLVLTVPTRDEQGGSESVVVHHVWWGHAEAPANVEQLLLQQRRGSGSGGHSAAMAAHNGPGGSGGFHRGGGGRSSSGYDNDRHSGSGGYRGSLGGGGSGGGGGRHSDRFQTTQHPFEVYVGNLPHGTSRDELNFLFQYFGVETVRITARGFGFVTLRSAEDMHRAVEELDGRDFHGQKLRVSCALPPK